MLTIFSIPKPFRGHIGVIQRNAVASWVRLADEVILFGNEEGAAEAARDLGAKHVPDVRTNPFGTPLLDDVFSKAEAISSTPFLTYSNGDIILREDFKRVLSALPDRRVLLAGRRWDLDITEPIDMDRPGWSDELESQAKTVGKLRGPEWNDYFAFRRGTLGTLPPFAVGRPVWDNWLLFRAREVGAWLVDATPSLTAIHQNHDYRHVPQSTGPRWEGPEADENLRLAGSPKRLFSLGDATHQVVGGKLVPIQSWKALCRHWETLPVLHPELDWEPRFLTRLSCPPPQLPPERQGLASGWYGALNSLRVPLAPMWRGLRSLGGKKAPAGS
jgi:hypothetical protein